MITLEHDSLTFRFPDVHNEAVCGIHFQRTLRLPDDGRTYPLPAGLGSFPLRHTDDFERLPEALRKRGGVVMPMWQAEAMWVSFGGSRDYPFAVKIAAGKINAVSGEDWREGLNRDPQDYMVVPGQPWLDGFCVSKGTIRQFVAAPLGTGITVEEQLTDAAEHGGIQIVVHPMKKDVYERERLLRDGIEDFAVAECPRGIFAPMGLAAGGKMRQEIYEDHYDFAAWDLRKSSRCFVTLLDAQSWHEVTGELPPTEPIGAKDYRENGIPWFDYYAADQKALGGSERLASVKTTKDAEKFGLSEKAWQVDSIGNVHAVDLGPNRRPRRDPDRVRESSF